MRLFERSNDERFVDVVTRLRAKILPGTDVSTNFTLKSTQLAQSHAKITSNSLHKLWGSSLYLVGAQEDRLFYLD